MRVIFMGTPDFAIPALKALVHAGHDIAAVYTQPPRPAGRGKQARATPVQKLAEDFGLSIRHPVDFHDPRDRAAFADLKADVAVVVAYGLILPPAVLEAPKYGCLNIHASLLPRWRGAAPIHRAIMAGDQDTGVCIMQMVERLDAGPVLMRREIPIRPVDTTGALHDRLSEIGAEMSVETLAGLPGLKAQPQPKDGITYAAKIDKAEARIDWAKPAIEVDRHIRGLSPWPGAWCDMADHQRVKVLGSCLAKGDGPPGMVLDDRLTVACQDGAVRLLRLQRAGKGVMDADDFLRGMVIKKGQKL